MHHALEIHEILLNIFHHCDRKLDLTSTFLEREISHLAVLARTCRAFKEPALDVLWEELSDLSPLARCILEAFRLVSPRDDLEARPFHAFIAPCLVLNLLLVLFI